MPRCGHDASPAGLVASRYQPLQSKEKVLPMSLTTATDDIRARLGGEVILPADPGYDDARALHNAMIDKRPAVIVRCRSASDVAGALEFARGRSFWSRSAAAVTTVRASVPSRAASSSTCRR